MFQILSLFLLVRRGLVGVSDAVLVFQLLSLRLLVHIGPVGVSDAVVLSLPKNGRLPS